MYIIVYRHEGMMKHTGKFETIQEANEALKELRADGVKEAAIRTVQKRK